MSAGGKRRVLFVSAIRSEYDILYAVMRAVDAHPALAAELVVTGAHLSPRFGSTVNEIERDGFQIVARLESLVDADTRAARVRGPPQCLRHGRTRRPSCPASGGN